MRWPVAAVALALAGPGCDDPNATPSPTAAPSGSSAVSAAPEALPLNVRWKDEPIALLSALAFSRGGAALHITFSTHPLECQHLRDAVKEHAGEVQFDVTIAPLLDPGGKENWAISSARFGQITRRGNLGAITISGYNPTEDVRATFAHSWPFPPSELKVDGQVVAKGCGVLPWSTKAKVLRQHELSASLAGKALVINGATIEPASAGTHTLRLTTEPHTCGTVIGSDVAMTLTLADAGDAVRAVRIEGYALSRTLFKQLEGSVLTAKRTPGTQEGTDSFALSGEADVGGFRLSLDGSATAERCGKSDAPPSP